MEDQDIREIERKKRSLKRYKKNRACIDRLKIKLVSLDERIKSVKSPSYSSMPRGGLPVTVDELVSDKIELEERIERLTEKGRVFRREILEEIDSLDDPRYCEILESFFIDGLSFEDIADEMGYAQRHVERLYSDAVEELALRCQ